MTLQRKTPLKSDPEKRRAWQTRSNETVARNRVQRARDLLKAGVPLPTMARVSRRRMELDGPRLRQSGSTLKQSPNAMAASAAQQAKTKAAGCCRVLSALEHDEPELWPADVRAALMSWNGPAPFDSAHIAGPHDCPDPDCVCNLARPLHRAYDLHRLNLLRYLTREEEAHAAWHVGILGALKRITGLDWVPVDGTSAGEDRLPLLAFDEQADVVRRFGLKDALRKLTGVSWESRPIEVTA